MAHSLTKLQRLGLSIILTNILEYNPLARSGGTLTFTPSSNPNYITVNYKVYNGKRPIAFEFTIERKEDINMDDIYEVDYLGDGRGFAISNITNIGGDC